MKPTIVLVLFAATTLYGQVQCTKYGNTVNCTDWNAIGRNMASGLAANAQRRAERKQAEFCRANPGQRYHDYTCPSLEEQAGTVAVTWIEDHPKFHQSAENAQAMATYMAEHKLDPTVYKSYDTAFKALKKDKLVALNDSKRK